MKKVSLEIKFHGERCLNSCQFLKVNRFEKDKCNLFDKELMEDDLFAVRCPKCIEIIKKYVESI